MHTLLLIQEQRNSLSGLFLFISCVISAAGLYYLAELVEEFSVMAKYVISWMVVVSAILMTLFSK